MTSRNLRWRRLLDVAAIFVGVLILTLWCLAGATFVIASILKGVTP